MFLLVWSLNNLKCFNSLGVKVDDIRILNTQKAYRLSLYSEI